MKNPIQYVRSLAAKLGSLRDTPHSIAGGIAIGIFMGFTPLFGLKTLLSLAGACLLRCNAMAAVITVSLHDLATPILPVLLRFEYDLGYFILSRPHHFPPKLHAHHIHLAELLKWTTFLDVGLPMLIGSLFISAPSALLFYAVSLAILKAREKRRKIR